MEKGEIAKNELVLLMSQCFHLYPIIIQLFQGALIFQLQIYCMWERVMRSFSYNYMLTLICTRTTLLWKFYLAVSHFSWNMFFSFFFPRCFQSRLLEIRCIWGSNFSFGYNVFHFILQLSFILWWFFLFLSQCFQSRLKICCMRERVNN